MSDTLRTLELLAVLQLPLVVVLALLKRRGAGLWLLVSILWLTLCAFVFWLPAVGLDWSGQVGTAAGLVAPSFLPLLLVLFARSTPATYRRDREARKRTCVNCGERYWCPKGCPYCRAGPQNVT